MPLWLDDSSSPCRERRIGTPARISVYIWRANISTSVSLMRLLPNSRASVSLASFGGWCSAITTGVMPMLVSKLATWPVLRPSITPVIGACAASRPW